MVKFITYASTCSINGFIKTFPSWLPALMHFTSTRKPPSIIRPFLPCAWYWKQSLLGLVGSGLQEKSSLGINSRISYRAADDVTNRSIVYTWTSYIEASLCSESISFVIFKSHEPSSFVYHHTEKNGCKIQWLIHCHFITCDTTNSFTPIQHVWWHVWLPSPVPLV